MNQENDDVYNYDKSFFYTLLESAKYRNKLALVQEQQGLIVCPLETQSQSIKSSNHQDLIDRHLFLPSPFLKNHYVHLTSNLTLLPSIYLVLDDSKLILIQNGQQICKYIKILNIEQAFNEQNKSYKILIVNKELCFKSSDQNKSSQGSDSDEFDTNAEDYDSDSSASSTKFQELTLNDVKTFGQSIDFMHNKVCIVKNQDLNSDEEFTNCFLGVDFLNEIELFKKTYIILYTHLDDCAFSLKKLYEKYVHRFMHSYYLEKRLRGTLLNSQIFLIFSIACENAINGCLFTRIWPCILKANQEADSFLYLKCCILKQRLKIEDSVLNSPESVLNSSEYFQLDKVYFNINFKLILKEIRKLPLLNNPFERLESIKTLNDLLSNELTILSLNSDKQVENFVITSEILIPLLAFILIKSNINCFKSIVYFIDTFSFSSQESLTSTSAYTQSTFLAELNFFMITFKASLQLIENS